jgi:hypothetical protein
VTGVACHTMAELSRGEGGVPLTMNFFLNLNCIWSDSRYIPVLNLLTYYLKMSWDLKELLPDNFVLFYLNEGHIS